jgi:anti-sigma factor RsiW
MRCRPVRERMSEYLDGELPPRERVAIEAHLEGCAECRAEAEALRQAEDGLKTLAAVEPAPDLSEDLRRRIAIPLPWRPRWGVAAAVVGAAVVVTAVAVLWLGPRKAPAPSVPLVREDVTQSAVVSMAQAPDVTAEIHSEMPPPADSPPATVSAPPPMPAEVVPAQVASPTVVSLPVHAAEPAELEEEAPVEAAPIIPSLRTEPERAAGVVLLLGRPKPAEPASSCYLEVSLPNGTRSVFERIAKPERAGALRVIHISYEQSAPQPKAQN